MAVSYRDGIPAAFSSVLFGALLPLAFAPWNWWITAFISCAALTQLLHKATPGKCFLRSLFFGLGLFGVGASWVFYSIDTYGNTGTTLAAIITSLFVLLLAIIFALPFTLLGFTHSNKINGLLIGFPAVWILGEMLRGWIFSGFPWLYLGYGFVDTVFSGWGPLVGVFGISAMVAFCGALLALLPYWKKSNGSLEVGVFFVAVFVIGGVYFKSQTWTQPTTNALTVGLMQPAIPLPEKWDKNQLQNTLQTYEKLNEQLLDNELIVWPESAIPALRREVKTLLEELEKQVLDLDIALVTGIPTQNSQGDYFNTLIALGKADGEYHKKHLVPFGEFVPFESLLRPFQGIFNLPMSSFSSGSDEQPPLYVKSYRAGTAICYEIAYTNLVRQASADAGFIMTLSNDAWFGDSIGPHQHLQIAQMRALENAKPVIRSTNDGISAIIDQKGRIQTSLPRFYQGVTSGWIIPQNGQTPYNRYGSLPILIAALVFLFITAAPAKEKQKRSHY